VTASEIALDGLRPEFLNNAVAALRLPSLPALVWWRGGDPAQTEEVVRLADRLVLDAEDPAPVWALVDRLAKHAPVSDLRWAALTRWRALMAHFFDAPGVAAAARTFTRLHVSGCDRAAARLFAAWLATSSGARQAEITVDQSGGLPVEAVTFGGDRDELSLRRIPDSSCIEGHAQIDGRSASRIASLGEQNLTVLIAEELRVRSRDVAFEAAVRAAGAIA
jgi:glucose-6-phosphate dehydrogenase assembly protein OpcA